VFFTDEKYDISAFQVDEFMNTMPMSMLSLRMLASEIITSLME
jgi:hypothetical protein